MHTGASIELLKLKNGDDSAVNYFCEELKTEISKTFEPRDRFKIATVPSSTAGKSNPGLTKLIRKLKIHFRGILNTGNLIKRIESIEPLHSGGDRDIDNHLATLIAIDSIKANDVIVLIDDVTTTGNSMKAAKQVLESTGAEVRLMIALGKTVRDSGTRVSLRPKTIETD